MKKGNSKLLTYAGLGLAAIFFLPKILKSNSTETAPPLPPDLPQGNPTPGDNLSKVFLEVAKILVSKEKETDTYSKVTLYIVVNNPTSEEIKIDGITGSLYYGVVPFAPINMNPKVIKANGATTIPLSYTQTYSSLPTPVKNMLKTYKNSFAAILTDQVIFKGNMPYNNMKNVPFNIKLSPYDSSKIWGTPKRIFGIFPIIKNHL